MGKEKGLAPREPGEGMRVCVHARAIRFGVRLRMSLALKIKGGLDRT